MTHSFPTRLSSDLKRTDPSRPERLEVIERNDWASTSGKLLMSRVFTREEFYDLVWSKPMTHLAKEFALSDVALHKVCKKHNIRSEEHTSELQSLMRNSYAVFCLKKQQKTPN